jgi:hypothetical protein
MTGGGWSKRGLGIPLADRVRASGPAGVPAASAAPAPGEPVSPARHCWVSGAADGDGVKRPGLLVEWRQGPVGWEGRVVYSARVRADEFGAPGWAVVEEWLPAELLTPP